MLSREFGYFLLALSLAIGTTAFSDLYPFGSSEAGNVTVTDPVAAMPYASSSIGGLTERFAEPRFDYVLEADWFPHSPNRIGNLYTMKEDKSAGPLRPWSSADGAYGGHITALRIDPSNPSILYVGGEACGIYRSTNAGDNWHQGREGIVSSWVMDIDIDPSNPDFLIAAANEWPGAESGDVYRTTDGSETWQSTGLEGSSWSAVHIVRNDPQRVLAGGEAGIYLSVDSGLTWSYREGTSYVVSLDGDPSCPDTIYAGGVYGCRYRSTDAGETWTVFAPTIPAETVSDIQVNPMNSQIIYCAAWSFWEDGTEGIYKSTNSGDSWTRVLRKNTLSVSIDTTNPLVLWVTGDRYFDFWEPTPLIWHSTNGGSTWTEIELQTNHYFAGGRSTVIESDPDDGNNIYVGLYRAGVWKSTDGGINWGESNTHLSATLTNCIAVHPSQPTTVYAGTYQSGFWKTSDGGNSWSWSASGIDELTSTSMDIEIDPNNPQTLYHGGYSSGIYKSINGGEDWFPTGLMNYDQISVVKVSPHNSQEIWAGVGEFQMADRGVWKSTNGGATFAHNLIGPAISSLEMSPFDPLKICAGSGNQPGVKAKIYLSTNGGTSWSEVFSDIPGGIITSISFDPVNPLVIYAASEDNNVLKSVNGGMSWISNYGGFDPGGRIYSIIADPVRPNTVYLAALDNAGFFVSFNGGINWYNYNVGLWNRSLLPLVVNQLGNWRIFYTGTSGTGIYYNFVRMP